MRKINNKYVNKVARVRILASQPLLNVYVRLEADSKENKSEIVDPIVESQASLIFRNR